METGFNGIPAMYDFMSTYNGSIEPSTVHTNSALKKYFMKYLLEKVISVYEFENLPKDWNKSYFMYVLFCFGFISVFKTDKYGVIPQHCQLGGKVGLYYQPTRAIVTNPLLKKSYNLKIDKECALIKLQPNYSGVMDIVSHYASMLALCSESASINLVNTKLAYVYMSNNKAQAESFKKMHDQITTGNPAVFLDKNLFDDEGSPQWLLFNQNLKQTYIAGDILQDMAKWEDKFNTEIGIPNANTEKKERLIQDEVNANNVDTMSKATLWLESIRDGLDKVNKLYGTNITVKFRFNDEANGSLERGVSWERY